MFSFNSISETFLSSVIGNSRMRPPARYGVAGQGVDRADKAAELTEGFDVHVRNESAVVDHHADQIVGVPADAVIVSLEQGAWGCALCGRRPRARTIRLRSPAGWRSRLPAGAYSSPSGSPLRRACGTVDRAPRWQGDYAVLRVGWPYSITRSRSALPAPCQSFWLKSLPAAP